MLVADYIRSKLGRFGFIIDHNEIEALLLKNGIGSDETYTLDSVDRTEQALYGFIPELLVVSSVSEGGYSISYDKEGIQDYYALLCHNLGRENKVQKAAQPKIKNKSDLW
ncbi:DUF6706 family protein [Emticicia sp. TH156]|uniref:DUF6706 family protein n=1 Tax=Emticicia sp. TH156 TaxID=2067454 RepID=UPI000C79106F|nr:DUF6706 family protein [Emticicia sp. TH156]PLK44402.1 hypothetical protein C0V77_11495 [Emticicia sp. TH156]